MAFLVPLRRALERQTLDLRQVIDELGVLLDILYIVGTDDEAILVQTLPHVVEQVGII